MLCLAADSRKLGQSLWETLSETLVAVTLFSAVTRRRPQ